MAIQKGGAQEARAVASSRPAARVLNGSAELLTLLTQQPEAPVLILPGERDAKAYAALSKTTLTLAATRLAHIQDFSLLMGRTVTLWLKSEDDTLNFVRLIGRWARELKVVDDHGEQSLADWIASGAKAGEVAAFRREHIRPYVDWAQERHVNALAADYGEWTEEGLKTPAPSAREPTATPASTAVVKAPEPASALPDFKSASAAWEHFNLAIGPGSRPWPNIDNVQRILAIHPQTSGRFSYDELGDRVLCEGKPWRGDDVLTLTTLLQRDLHFQMVKSALVGEAVEAYAQQKRVHPVREYLASLPKHDGQRRVRDFFSAACGAAESDYMRAVSLSFFGSAIGRIYDPGCIVRTTPVLEGAQEAGKSTTLAILGGEFYLDNARKIDSKEFEQDIQGYWIVELSELVSMMKSSVEAMKAALTRRDDVFRASYGRRARPHPRSCIFVGTTNSTAWQFDETGGTRFLPVACGTMDLAWTRTHRDQLWAEALALYRSGVCWWDIPKDAAQVEQEARHVADAWEEPIGLFIASRQSVTIGEIFDRMDIDYADRRHGDTIRIAKILATLGWRVHVDKVSGRSVKVYKRRPEP